MDWTFRELHLPRAKDRAESVHERWGWGDDGQDEAAAEAGTKEEHLYPRRLCRLGLHVVVFLLSVTAWPGRLLPGGNGGVVKEKEDDGDRPGIGLRLNLFIFRLVTTVLLIKYYNTQ
ncbi:hypothetical protein R3P38DRAFT_1707093 [Favolaschia claudopus]|uniref:Uncharacterized protein n=1 Tax=Favolaschia claudopus TaxID=2862362 RepID=A0AAW0AC27_9AGAR